MSNVVKKATFGVALHGGRVGILGHVTSNIETSGDRSGAILMQIVRQSRHKMSKKQLYLSRLRGVN